jgi:hypothetical protein
MVLISRQCHFANAVFSFSSPYSFNLGKFLKIEIPYEQQKQLN